MNLKSSNVVDFTNSGRRIDYDWESVINQLNSNDTALFLIGANDIPTGIVSGGGSYENWDFEIGTLNQWGMWNDVSVTTNCMHTGLYGLKITGSTAASERIVVVKPNTKYTKKSPCFKISKN